MNKSEIVRGIAAQSNLTKPQVEEVVNRFLDVVSIALSCDEDVMLTGFGKFRTSRRKAREGVNPRNQDPVEIPSRRSVRFSASPKLKTRLNGEP